MSTTTTTTEAHIEPHPKKPGFWRRYMAEVRGNIVAFILAIGLVVLVPLTIFVIWPFFQEFGQKVIESIPAPAPAAPAAPAAVEATALVGAADTADNRGLEMEQANCPVTLKRAIDDGFAPWDDMQYNGSFYSYNLALKANCGTESVLAGDLTPDFNPGPIVEGELTPEQQALLDQMVDQVLNQ